MTTTGGIAIRDRTVTHRWSTTPRLIRFFLVGGVNTAFGYSAFALLLFAGLHYAWAALLATIAGVTFNYFTTGRLVFEHMSRGRIVRFAAVYGAVYVLNVASLAGLERFRVDAYLGGLLLLLPSALLSYVLMKHFVFWSDRAPD